MDTNFASKYAVGVPMHTADGSLSSGAFGVLYTGRDKAGHEVAIKFSKCGGGPHKNQEWYDQFADPRYRPLLLEEVITHKKASSTGNKHVVKLFGAFEETCELREIAAMGCDKPGRRNRLVLVMEKCSGHDLYDVLSTGETLPGVLPSQVGEAPRTRPYNEVDKRGLFKQCAGALEAMHAVGLVHRDIKPENIVMKEKPVPGVLPDLAFIDFGLAIDLERGDIRTGRTGIIGSRNYAAPELFVGESTFAGTENYQPAIDVYAMGVVLFMMLLGFHDKDEDYPFDIRGESYEVMRRKRSHLTFLNPAHPHHAALSKYSPMVRDLLARMLDPNKATRITMKGVMAHPWMTSSPPDIVSSCSGAPSEHSPTWLPHRRAMHSQFITSLVYAHGKELGRRFTATQKILSPRSVALIYKDFHALMVAKDSLPPHPSSGGGGGGGGHHTVAHPVRQAHVHGLTPLGFRALLEKQGVEPPLAQLVSTRVFTELDRDGDGLLLWKELMGVLPLLAEGPINDLYPEDTLRLFWDLWVADGGKAGGAMNPHQLRDMLCYTHAVAGSEEELQRAIHDIFDIADANHDHLITYEEFLGALARMRKAGGGGGGGRGQGPWQPRQRVWLPAPGRNNG